MPAKSKGNVKAVHPIKSMVELSGLVGRDVSQVSRWTKREDWPFARKAPWPRADVPKMLRWVADVLDRDTAPDRGASEDEGDPDGVKALRKQKLREEVRKLRANADQAETALAKERGQLYDAAEVDRDRAEDGVVVRNSFNNLASQLVPLALSHGMPHEAAAVFHQQVEEAVNAILRRLSSEGSEVDDDSEAEVLSGAVPA